MDIEFVPAVTTREAALVQLEIYRRMPPGRTLKMAMEMSDFMRDIAAAGVRRRHPEYDEQQVKMALIRLTAGEDLFHKAFPGQEIQV
ncbi:MAG TPA: hypothetical protein VE988_23735 [Gemmataceae bacterium]|nr:hypothetical protein [Gemmataceae bacterium]